MIVSIRGRQFDVAEEPRDFWLAMLPSYEPNTFKFLDEHLTPETTFLDLGAWVGVFSLYASRVAKRVVAVEPDPIAFAILRDNVYRNEAQIETYEEAIVDYEGMITLGSCWLGASTTRANPEGGTCSPWAPEHTFMTKCSRLGTFCREHDLEDPLVIKVDVEGSEETILRDTEFLASRKPPMIVAMHPWWWQKGTMERTIEEMGKIYTHSRNDRGEFILAA